MIPGRLSLSGPTGGFARRTGTRFRHRPRPGFLHAADGGACAPRDFHDFRLKAVSFSLFRNLSAVHALRDTKRSERAHGCFTQEYGNV